MAAGKSVDAAGRHGPHEHLPESVGPVLGLQTAVPPDFASGDITNIRIIFLVHRSSGPMAGRPFFP